MSQQGRSWPWAQGLRPHPALAEPAWIFSVLSEVHFAHQSTPRAQQTHQQDHLDQYCLQYGACGHVQLTLNQVKNLVLQFWRLVAPVLDSSSPQKVLLDNAEPSSQLDLSSMCKNSLWVKNRACFSSTSQVGDGRAAQSIANVTAKTEMLPF